MTTLDKDQERRVRDEIPFDAIYQQRHGRVIGRLLNWPIFRPDDGGDIVISWSLAAKLQQRGNNEKTTVKNTKRV
jgi:hypothetical protein